MPQTISLSQDYDKALSVAKRIILAGGTFVYPTDTLYGIGCDATSKTAVEKIVGIAENEDFVAMIPVGYPDEQPVAPPRKAIGEIVKFLR